MSDVVLSTEISPDSAWQMLAEAMAVPITIPWVKIAYQAIVMLVMGILVIAKYFFDKNKRETEAYKTDIETRQRQSELLERAQHDAASSMRDNLAGAYADDYKLYVKMITKEDYSFLGNGKIPLKCIDEISHFVYNKDLAVEDRASRIILVVKKTLV